MPRLKNFNNYETLMHRLFIILIFLMGNFELSKAQDIVPDSLLSMSIHDLMKLKINVSSIQKLEIFDTPSAVTIIDKDMIKDYNFLSIAEALSSVAGIEVYQTIIDRNVTTIRGILQNFYANKILLMINNIPTWQPIYGDGHLERININDVERIEILKGAASVLYGSNAYTGVVNIILKDSKTDNLNAYGQVGYKNLGAAGLNYTNIIGDVKIFISANASTEEKNHYEFENRKFPEDSAVSSWQFKDDEKSRNFNFIANYKQHTLFLNNFYYEHTYYGAHPSFLSGGGLFVENQGTLINYNYSRKLFEKSKILFNTGYDHFEREFPLSFDRSSQIFISASRLFSDLKLHYYWNKYLNLEFGLFADERICRNHETRDEIKDTLKFSNMSKYKNILELSTFGQVDFNYDFLNILLGGRYTHNEQFGNDLSSRVTVLVKLNEKNSIKAIFGRSFRVPTMFELYFKHSTVNGNENLEPETSLSHELAYLTTFNNFFFQAIAYYGEYKNLIQRAAVSDNEPMQYQNVSSFKGIGTEIELKYLNPKLIGFFLNYNYISEYKKENFLESAKFNNFQFVPKQTLSFGVNKKIKNVILSLTGRLFSKVQGHLAEIEPQFLLDINIGYIFKADLFDITHSISLKNITNSEYLIPEYIRQTSNINSIPTMGFGRRIIYTCKINLN